MRLSVVDAVCSCMMGPMLLGRQVGMLLFEESSAISNDTEAKEPNRHLGSDTLSGEWG